jgi:hypothetical protein
VILDQESHVAIAIQKALHFWAVGDYKRARNELALKSSSSIFIKPPKESKGGKWKYRIYVTSGCLFVTLGLFKVWTNPYGLPNHQTRLKPIPIQESDVLAFFHEADQMDLETNKHIYHLKSLMGYRALLFSPAEMVSPKLMTLLTNDTSLGQQGINRWLQNPSDGNLLINAFSDRDFSRWLHAGYINLPKGSGINWSNILA